MINSIFAVQEAGASPLSGWVIMMCMMAGMWFLMIAPQRKRQKQHKLMLESLKKGDKVLTISGIYGVISKLEEGRLLLEVAQGVQIEMERHAIQAKA